MTRTQRIARQNRALLAAATALGLWLGIAAPAVSPVTPVVAVAAAPPAAAPAAVAPAPVAPAGPDGGSGRPDGGRR